MTDEDLTLGPVPKLPDEKISYGGLVVYLDGFKYFCNECYKMGGIGSNPNLNSLIHRIAGQKHLREEFLKGDTRESVEKINSKFEDLHYKYLKEDYVTRTYQQYSYIICDDGLSLRQLLPFVSMGKDVEELRSTYGETLRLLFKNLATRYEVFKENGKEVGFISTQLGSRLGLVWWLVQEGDHKPRLKIANTTIFPFEYVSKKDGRLEKRGKFEPEKVYTFEQMHTITIKTPKEDLDLVLSFQM